MSAILHSIVAGIEYDRIKNNILMWKYNALEASMWKRVNEERRKKNPITVTHFQMIDAVDTCWADARESVECWECGKRYIQLPWRQSDKYIKNITSKNKYGIWDCNWYCKDCEKEFTETLGWDLVLCDGCGDYCDEDDYDFALQTCKCCVEGDEDEYITDSDSD